MTAPRVTVVRIARQRLGANPHRVFISGHKRGFFGVIKRELLAAQPSKPSSGT